METQLIELAYALDTLYFLVMGAFVMWMAAGFTMLEAGLVRAKNTAEIEKAEQEAKDQNLVNQYIQTLDKALSDFDPSAVQEVFSEIAEDKDRLKSKVYNGLQGDVKEFVTEVMVSEEAA